MPVRASLWPSPCLTKRGGPSPSSTRPGILASSTLRTLKERAAQDRPALPPTHPPPTTTSHQHACLLRNSNPMNMLTGGTTGDLAHPQTFIPNTALVLQDLQPSQSVPHHTTWASQARPVISFRACWHCFGCPCQALLLLKPPLESSPLLCGVPIMVARSASGWGHLSSDSLCRFEKKQQHA